ncbi:MAG: cyclic nucleotide-binding domain-containing protein, partial [Pseudomonadota bacterium]
ARADFDTRVAALGPTEIVGEMALLTGNPRTATVRARGEVKALRLERDTMMRILGEFPGMSVELLRVMTRRLEQTTHELSEARAARARATGAA